ncbi:MAG: tetratricopeptide repeat protein [Bdellovibrionales bacterium]
MTKLLLLLALTITFSACGTKKKQDVKLNKHRAFLHAQMGDAHLANRKYPEALKEYLNANRLDPQDEKILNSLAIAYYRRGRPDKAKSILKNLLKKHKNYTEAKINLGRILVETGEYDKSIEIFKTAADDLTYPHPEKYHTNYGLAYFQLNQFEDANKQFALAIQSNRNYCPALSSYARSQYFLKNHTTAEPMFEKAQAKCWKSAERDEILYYSGLNFIQLGKNQKAKERLKFLVRKSKDKKTIEKSKKALSLLDLN